MPVLPTQGEDLSFLLVRGFQQVCSYPSNMEATSFRDKPEEVPCRGHSDALSMI